jgi:hypothetical protein
MTRAEAIAKKEIAENQLTLAQTALSNALSSGGVVEYTIQNGEDRRSVRMVSSVELMSVIKNLRAEIAGYDRIIDAYNGTRGFIIGGGIY